MQADFPEAQYYTVQFAVEQPSNVTPDVIADLSWSVEGNTVRRRISIGNGTSISGCGAAIRVKVSDATLIGSTGIPYNVSIQVSKGTRPNPGQPVFLRAVPNPGAPNPYFIFIAPGGAAIIPIPNDAGVISADVEAISTLAIPTLSPNQVFVQQEDLTFTHPFKAYYPLIETGFVPVFPTAANLKVTNLSATDTIAVSCLFGIDG